VIAIVARLGAAHTRADEHAAAFAVLDRQIELRVGDRLPGGEERQLTHAIEHAQARRCKVAAAVEINRGTDGRMQLIRPRSSQAMHARAARFEIHRELIDRVAERRQHAEAGDGDPARHHVPVFTLDAPPASCLRAISSSI
jgi:hypothetical protein